MSRRQYPRHDAIGRPSLDGPGGERPVALVTGGSKGIGRAITTGLARAGMTVVLTSREQARATAIAAEMQAAGLNVFGRQLDLSDTVSVERIVPHVIDRHGRLDILVNNALTRSVAGTDPQSDEGLAAELDANIGSPLRLCHAARRHLADGGGAIVNIGSAITRTHVSGLVVYAIIKGAIRQMTRALAAEWGADGIRVNCVSPGFTRNERLTETGWSTADIDARFDAFARFSVLDTYGWPDDIADLCCWLASPAARFVTGADFVIDGGLSVRPIDAF